MRYVQRRNSEGQLRLGGPRYWKSVLSVSTATDHMHTHGALEKNVLGELVEWFREHDTSVFLVLLGVEQVPAVGRN
jgi:hypothetical protein